MIHQLPEVRVHRQWLQDSVLTISGKWLSHIKSDFIIFRFLSLQARKRREEIFNSKAPLYRER